MLIPLAEEVQGSSDLAHQARRFRVVLDNFSRNVELLFSGVDSKPDVDAVALAAAFSNWRDEFEASRQYAAVNRADFVFCAAGLMLKQLFIARPLASLQGVGPVKLGDTTTSWPEGYVYTNYCISMAVAVLSDLHHPQLIDQKLADDPKFWNSFRENVAENVSTAPGFLDLLFGNTPNWEWPDVPAFRTALHQNDAIAGQKRDALS